MALVDQEYRASVPCCSSLLFSSLRSSLRLLFSSLLFSSLLFSSLLFSFASLLFSSLRFSSLRLSLLFSSLLFVVLFSSLLFSSDISSLDLLGSLLLFSVEVVEVVFSWSFRSHTETELTRQVTLSTKNGHAALSFPVESRMSCQSVNPYSVSKPGEFSRVEAH